MAEDLFCRPQYPSAIDSDDLIEPAKPDGRPVSHRLLVRADNAVVALQFELGRPLVGTGTSLVAGFCCVVRTPDNRELPIVISALDIPVGATWELRTSGLWAEQICEQPFVHWSYGLEAFGLAIDRPDELLRQGFGHRVPIGWELDFVAGDSAQRNGESVIQNGRVEGILLTADGELSIEGAEAVRAFWPGSATPLSNLRTLVNRWPTDGQNANHGDQVEAPIAVIPTLSGPWVVEGPATFGKPSSGSPPST